METGEDKYKKLVQVLRGTKPEPGTTGDMERAILERIGKHEGSRIVLLMDCVFGWVNVGWIRRSLIAASFAVTGIFIIQQNRILKEMESLKHQILTFDMITSYDPSHGLEKKALVNRLSMERSEGDSVKMTVEDIDHLMKSVNELNMKYQDLIDIINDDPVLRDLVEKKLKARSSNKIKL